MTSDSQREAELRNWLVDYLVTTIGCNPDEVDPDLSFNDLSVGSRDAVVLSGELSELIGWPVSPVEFWQHPTINALAHFLSAPEPEPDPGPDQVEHVGLDQQIAVIGLGCRFPGDIDGPEALWQFLLDGRCAVGVVPADRWQGWDDGSPEVAAAMARTTRWGSFLRQIDTFDADFFEISPSEAASIDPQQRMLLEVAYEALEHAGVPVDSLRHTQTGVFAGACLGEYGYLASKDLDDVDAWTGTGGALSIIANRLSYFLDVRGPSVVVDTACSSSLVAVHLACQSLRTGDSNLAIAAGVNLLLSPAVTRSFDAAEAMSPTGACHAFDASADGFVRGEGCGVAVLKRLGDAVRDGNRVLAVVRGSAVNQDGRSNGLMAPNPAAQIAVLRAACANAGVQPRDVDYVEAHGTGTLLGDPIEARALGTVYGRGRPESSPLLIGALKTNLGHLEAAAGIAGFLKTVLTLQHGQVPRNLHFKAANPLIPFRDMRLKVVAEHTNWPSTGRPRRAGVSSFGFGGTNAHVVLEAGLALPSGLGEAPSPPVTTLVVSGKTVERVGSWAGVLADWLEGAGAAAGLADAAHTLSHHRGRQARFATVCARDRAGAISGLRALAVGRPETGVVAPHEGACGPGTVFVYSGQGSQWPGMGQRLFDDEPTFAAAVSQLEPAFIDQLGFSLEAVLRGGRPVAGDIEVQSVLVGLQLALTSLWRTYGVEPDAVIGHSMGEVTAAVVAGALTATEGFRVIATRSRLMSRMAGAGAVALVELDTASTEALIADYPQLSVTVYASPRQTVVAGPTDQIDGLLQLARQQNTFARLVNMEVPSHHAMMDPVLPLLRAELADLAPQPPRIPIISTSVENAGAAVSFDASHWAANLRNPVRFAEAITTAAEEHTTFIEVSPHPLLTHAITETIGDAHHHSLGTLQRDTDDTLTFQTRVNTIHTTHPRQTEHPPGPHPFLPTTPWRHTSHWFTRKKPTTTPVDEVESFAHVIDWQPRQVGRSAAMDAAGAVAVVGDNAAATAELRKRLEQAGHPNADAADARYVIYFADAESAYETETDVDAAVRLTAQVTELVQRLARRDERDPVALWILTTGVHEAARPDSVRQSCLSGLAAVIAAEQPQIWGGLVDLAYGHDISETAGALALVLGEPSKTALVLRDGVFHAPVMVPITGEPVRPPLRCKPDAAYLVTGGLGALGLLIAGWLADAGARRLLLCGRTPLPPRRDWEGITDIQVRQRISAIRELELRGVSVEVVPLDIGSAADVGALLAARDRAGAPPIRGVIHAAGVTRDELVTSISDSSIRHAMWPKVGGARVLHDAFPCGSIDFLYLTASAGALFGIPGQGSYAAANAYLDALARFRHRAGCHSVSIDWTAWQGIGMASDNQIVAHELARLGSRELTPGEAFTAWEHVHRFDIAQVVVLPVSSPVDREVATAAWSQMSASDLRDHLMHEVRAIVGRELRTAESELDTDRPFVELGLNSMMALSIRRDIERLVGLELAATMLWNYPTVAALSAYLAGKLAPTEEPSPAAVDRLSEPVDSVLDSLFDGVESTPAGMETSS